MKSIAIKNSLSDYINSEGHDERVSKISSASIKPEHKNYNRYKWIANKTGKALRIIYSGLSDIYRYASNLFDFEALTMGNYYSIEFEDFAVYFIVADGFKRLGGITALIDAKIVYLPRKTKLIKSQNKEHLGILDSRDNGYYLLPELYYPKNKADIRRMISWMRIYKTLLCISFIDSGGDGKLRYEPSRRKIFIPWERYAVIYRGDDAIVRSNPENPYASFVDYTLEKEQYVYYCWCEDMQSRYTVKEPKEITQELIDEFVDLENNRYKILR